MTPIARTFSVLRVAGFSWGRALLLSGAALLLGWCAFLGICHVWANRHLQIAQTALARDDLDLAARRLEDCLRYRDDDPDIFLLAAQTARRRDDYDRADAYLTAAERLERRSGPAGFERDLLIAQQGDPDRVEKKLKAIMQIRPDQTATILEAVGKGYLNRFVKTDALDCFNGLLKVRPDYAVGLLLRGKTHEAMERSDKALQDYRRAVELSPALDDARLHLAARLHRDGRSWEAIPHYECLRQRRPRSAEVLLGLARCRRDLNEIREARESLDALLAENLDHADALLERGRLEFHAGQTALAEKFLRQAARLSPNDEATHRALLLCLQTQGKESEAALCLAQLDALDVKLRQVDELIRRTKDGRRDAPLRWEIGELLRQLGREQDAVSYYFAALGEDANYAPARAALADYFQRTGQSYRAAMMRREVKR